MEKTIFTYKKNRNFVDSIYKIIDRKMVRRLERLSTGFNHFRQGKMAIFANEHIGIHINQFGYYDKLGLDSLFAFLAPVLDDLRLGIALDIGANIGNHSIYFSDYFGSVYSFEPNPRTFDLLSFNSKIVENVLPFNFGLGNADEVVELNENMGNMGASSIKWGGNAGRKKVAIKIKKLDEINVDLAGVSFIKIDVEGFESDVIRGASGTIKRNQPIIVLEQNKSEFINGSTDSIKLLEENGYRFCWYQSAALSKNRISRRFYEMKKFLFGKTDDYHVITNETVPKNSYGMLIAVPDRFQVRLGLTKPNDDPGVPTP